MRTTTWVRLGAALALALGLLAPASEAPAQTPGSGCNLCHGELELLRQHVATLADARALLVTEDEVAGSVHDTLGCGSCHRGFDRFPHPEAGGVTRSCASCHEDQVEPWSRGAHALADGQPESEGATCAACHGVHDAARVDSLTDPAVVRRLNATCASCHPTATLPPSDPHADTVACAACHAPHETLGPSDPASSIAPLRQWTTCGACHEEPARNARADVHGQALSGLEGPASMMTLGQMEEPPPTCSSCHGAHGMRAPSHPGFEHEMVEACGACHQDHYDSYFGTYHGKATAVGSEISATCDQCHGSHSVLPASNPGSMVAEGNLVETCGECHEQARRAFVAYDSHPDFMDPERNAPLHYSFVFMNVLLVGVLAVFGLHTALWWVRLTIDRRKGVIHGPGGGHE